MSSRQQVLGISLIEALVALAVMAFGVLGLVGMQTTMRQNADTSKQRSEAVRIAQEAIERSRAFSVLIEPSPADPNIRSYAEVSSSEVAHDTDYVTNTSYTVKRTVIDPTEEDPNAQRVKSLAVEVSWSDRSKSTQTVQLSTTIAGVAPELAGSLGIPANAISTSQLRRRHIAIPLDAIDRGNGTSIFTPPGAGTVSWVFNNLTGNITSICNPTLVCTDGLAYLLSGYVRFATTATAPTPANAENPVSAAIPLNVQVIQTLPTAQTISCYSQGFTIHVTYYCAVPVTGEDRKWTGRSTLVSSADLPISISLSDPAAGNYKVCRYTSEQTDTPTKGNADHPLVYTEVAGPLTQQNFLVTRAGSGTTAFPCPGDDTGTAFVNGNTWKHQPNS